MWEISLSVFREHRNPALDRELTFLCWHSQGRDNEGRMGLNSGGLTMRIIQTWAGETVTCHGAKGKVNTGQRTIFAKLIKHNYLNCAVSNRHVQEGTHTFSCALPTSPCFPSIPNEESGDGCWDRQPNWVRSSLSDALLLNTPRDNGQKMSQVSIFLFNTLIFLLRLARWNYNGQICWASFEANLKK